MNNKLLKLSLLLTTSIVFSSCSLTDFDVRKCPQYSSDKQFSFYAYTPPGKGYYTVDGLDYPAKVVDGQVVSFQTVEKYQEYKDCGFDTIMFQADDPYMGETYSTSHIKDLMDKAYSVGLKSIIFDNRLYTLSNKKVAIVGEGCTYQTQTDLENYVRDCMKDYSTHESFIGLLIKDEPVKENLPAIGALMKAVKAVNSNCFVQCNLFPLSESCYNSGYYCTGKPGLYEGYKTYLRDFLRYSESNYVMADSYPMKTQNGNDILDPNHIKTIQLMCDVAKEYDAEVYAVAQTSAWKSNGIQKARKCTKQDMYWQTNFYMGMGVKQISYFTYQTKKTNQTNGEYFEDGASFIKWNGEKTAIYDYMKDIHAQMQVLAPAILNYEYQRLSFFTNGLPELSYVGGVIKDNNFKKLEEVSVSNNQIVFVTELYDAEKDLYMYMFLNTANPSTNLKSEDVTVSFKDTNALSIYSEGKHYGKNYSSSYKFSLKPGEGLFVIPFNV